MISRRRPEIISSRTKSGWSAPHSTKFLCPISFACPFRSMVSITASTRDTLPVMAVFALAQKKRPKRSSSPARSERLLELNRSAASKRKLQLLPSPVGESSSFCRRPRRGAKAEAFAQYCREQKLESADLLGCIFTLLRYLFHPQTQPRASYEHYSEDRERAAETGHRAI